MCILCWIEWVVVAYVVVVDSRRVCSLYLLMRFGPGHVLHCTLLVESWTSFSVLFLMYFGPGHLSLCISLCLLVLGMCSLY